MPAALPLIAGAFLAAGSVATAIGLTGGLLIAGLAISWAAVLTITGVALLAVSYLARKTPKPDSAGSQLQQKLDPQAGVPIAYGRTATGGTITDRLTWGAKNAFYGIVTVLSAGGPIAGIEAYRAGDYPITFAGNPAYSTATVANVGGYSGSSKLYKNKLRQRWQNGDAPAATTPAGASGFPMRGGALSGLAHAITSYEYSTDAFPQGLPASMWTLRGVRLYDPRQDSTYPGGSGAQRVDQPATWTYSENPYLAALQWTLGRYENGHRVYGIGAKWSEVDVASFVNGANVADANSWKIGGVVTTLDDKYAVLASMLSAGGGVPVARGAQIAVSVNAPKTSVLTLTAADIIGEVEMSSSTSFRDRQNTIIPRYREESQNWEIISGERVSAAQYVTEDAGESKSVEIEFPLVQQAAQAHQLAAYELVNSREFLTFTVRAKQRLLAARVGDCINVTVPEIASRFTKCLVAGREFNPADMSVTLTLKSETDAKHAFALGQTQEAPPSAKLDGYDPSNPGAPAATAWSITGTQISNGTTTLPVLVINGATDDPNASTVIVEYRPTGSSAWLNYGEFPRTTTRIEVSGLTDATAYEVALSYRTVRGVIGDRLVLSATAGAFKVDWETAVTGPNKPANNADVTGDNTSRDTYNVGGRPANQIVAGIDLLPTLRADIAKALADGQAQADAAVEAATPPGSVSNIVWSNVLTDSGADVTLTWSSAAGATGYEVELAENGGGGIVFAAPSTSYRFAGKRNTNYRARVRALKINVPGAWVSAADYTTGRDTVGPAAPSGLAVDPGLTWVDVSVFAPADADQAKVQINLKRADGTIIDFAKIDATAGTRVQRRFSELARAASYSVVAVAFDSSDNISPATGEVAFQTTDGYAAGDLTPDASVIKTVTSLPATATDAKFVYFGGALYRWTGSTWTKSVDGGDITTGTVTGAAIAPATLGEEKLVPASITATSLAPLAVTGDKIATKTIAGDKIVDATIGATQIMSGGVGTQQLAPNSVVRDKIAEAAVDASRLQDRAVTTNKMDTAAVTTDKVADAAIVTDKIRNDAINADKILAGAVNETKIQNGAITETKIKDDSISTPKLRANAITADKIDAGAVTARALAIGNFDNIIPDGDMRDRSFWETNSGTGISFDLQDQNSAWKFARTMKINASTFRGMFSRFFPVEIGATYKLTYSIWFSEQFNGWLNICLHQPGIRWNPIKAPYDVGVDPTVDNSLSFHAGDTQMGLVDKIFTVPAEATNSTRQMQFRFDGQWTAGYVEFMVKIVRVSDTTLIKDGAITTDKIVANSITGDKIQANAIDATKIQANSIDADKIKAGAITIGSDGRLGGAGSGQVTIGGLGYTGDLNATRGAPAGTTVGTTDAGTLDTRVAFGLMSQDTRNNNERPQYYVDRANLSRVFNEFKYLYVVGVPGVDGYGQLTTTIPWGDLSGGPIHQEIRDQQGRYWNRYSLDYNTWSAWTDTGAQVNIGTTTISGGKITTGSLTAQQIAANTITGANIAANTISTKNMLIGDTTNFAENPTFAAGLAGWNDNSGFGISTNPAQAYKGNNSAFLGGNSGVLRNNALMKVAKGDQLLAFAYINQTGSSGPNGMSYVRMSGVDVNGNEIWATVGQRVNGYTGTYQGYQRVIDIETVPDSVVGVRVEVVAYKDSGDVYVGMVGLMRRMTGELIVDGAITADKIAANSINANKLSIATRPISTIGLNFRVAVNGNLEWDGGGVQYTDNSGNYVYQSVAGNFWSTGNGGEYWYIFCNPGSENLMVVSDTSYLAHPNYIRLATWQRSTGILSVNAGVATLINGDKIVTGSINADRIIARTITADRIATGAITANEIAANTISTNKLTVATRPVSVSGINIRCEGSGVVWDAGYISFVDDNGNVITKPISAGSVVGSASPAAPMFIQYNMNGQSTYLDYNSEKSYFASSYWKQIATWNGGTDLAIHAGVSTVINGDRIVTGSIDANRIRANTVLADSVVVGGQTLASVQASANNSGNNRWFMYDDHYIIAGNRLTKTKNGGWSGNAYTRDLIPDACKISGRLATPDTFIGLSDGQENGDYQTIDYAWHRSVDGNTYIYENGVQVQGIGNSLNGGVQENIMQVVYDGKTIRYIRNELVHREITVGPNRKFAGAVAIASIGSYVDNLSLTPYSDNSLNRSDPADRINNNTTTISGGKITTGSITANQIAANTITGDRLVAGTISAAQIASGAITATKLAIGNPDNIIPDGNMLDVAFWNGTAGSVENGNPATFVGVGDQNTNWKFNRRMTVGAGNAIWYTPFFPVEIGATYKVSYSVWTSPDFSGWINVALHLPGIAWWTPKVGYGVDPSQDGNHAFHNGDNTGGAIIDRILTIPNEANNSTKRSQFRFDGHITAGYMEYMVKIVRVSDTTLIQDGAITTDKITVNSLNGDRISVGTLDANRIVANSVMSGNVYVSSSVGTQALDTVATRAANPAQRVNESSTQIDPGRILISGATSLASWRNGGDNTKIEGGSIAANTISANKLTIGNRGISWIGLNFEWNPDNGWINWSQGFMYYQDDIGNAKAQYVAAGNTGGFAPHAFFYWIKDSGSINFTRSENEAFGGTDRVMLGSWWGGSDLNMTYGGTIINGDRITTGTVNADRIKAGTVLASSVIIGGVSGSNTVADAFKRADYNSVTGAGKPETYTVMARGNQVSTLPANYQHGMRSASGGVFTDTLGSDLRSDNYGRSYTLMWRINADYWAIRLYDVYGNSHLYTDDDGASGAQAMANRIAGLPNGTPVVIFTSDEPNGNRMTAGLPEQMYSCGASRTIFGASNWTGWDSYILVGTKGIGEGNGIERYKAGGSESFVSASFSIVNGVVQGSGKTLTSAKQLRFDDGRVVDELHTVQAGATVGAPAGTMIGNTEAQTVTNWAYTGQQDPAARINSGGSSLNADRLTGGTALPNNLLVSGTSTTLGTINAVVQDPAYYINQNYTTINGGKITTGSITAAQIAAYSISADRLVANSIGAGQIAAGSITAGQIAAYSLTGDRIAANTITADKLQVNSLSAVSGTIGTLRTATSGGRMELSDNVIKIYDEAGNLRAKIGNLAL